MAFALLAGRWMLALVLMGAGLTKLLTSDRQRQVDAVRRYGVIPEPLIVLVAVLLPWLETILGGLLAVGVQVATASAVAGLTVGCFGVVIGWHLLLGHSFSCGCASHDKPIGWNLVLRDLALAGVAAAVVLGRGGGLALWPGWGANLPAATASQLIPAPMLVILSVTASRLALIRLPLWPHGDRGLRGGAEGL